MINKYKNIIWDWNGTILNDVDLCVDISNTVISQEGLESLTRDGYRDVFGFPIISYYERIGIDLNKISMESLTKRFISLYMSSVKSCKLHIGVEDVIVNLKDANKNQFILTAAHTDAALELLAHFDIRMHFDDVVGLDNHRAESKIDRGKDLIRTNGVSTNDSVLIGDTIHDFEVAEQLGVHCILIANGHQSKHRLTSEVGDRAIVLDRIGQVLG